MYKCFAGQLTKDDVESYLTDLEQIGVLRLDAMTNGDKRLQIPYSGNADVFDVRKEMLMKKYTRYELFKKNGIFAKSMESKIWDKNSASYGRMYIAACDAGTTSINARFNEVQAELKKYSYKFGILAITISESSQFAAMQDKVKTIAAQDTTGRMAIYLIKSPLTDEDLDRWYNAMTHSELAAEEGKSGDADKYSDEASTIVEEWSGTAKDDQLMAVCGEKVYPSEYGTEYFAPKLEQDILFGSVFIMTLEKKLLALLNESGIHYTRNGGDHTLPGIISLSFDGKDGEAILHRMDLMGISISTGSACDSKNTKISHVLQAIHMPESLARGTIRISLGKNNTEEDVNTLAIALKKILL